MTHTTKPKFSLPHVRELWLISRFELIRLFKTPRGLVAILSFSIIWYFFLKYPVNFSSKIIAMDDFRHNIEAAFGKIGLNNVLGWPVPEFSLYWIIALYSFPIFTLLFSADQTCSDRARGTLRFLTLRTSRECLFLGRFLGQLLIQLILITGTVLATILMTFFRDDSLLLAAINSAIVVVVNLVIMVMPFTALMAFLSAGLRSSKMTTMLGLIIWGIATALLGWTTYNWPSLAFLNDWLLGTQRLALVQTNGWTTLNYALAPILQTLFFLYFGLIIMNKNAL